MIDTNYRAPEKLFFYDKYVEKLFLWMIPGSITPNHITVFRFLATPAVAWFMFFDHFTIGLFSFLLLAFTDILDGSLARTRKQITKWGMMYDPLADKILIATAVFIIVLRYIDFWTAILIIGIDLLIVIVAFARKEKGGKIQANIWGKIKMSLQVGGVTILLLAIVFNLAILLPFASNILYLAIAFAIVSLLTYGI